MTESDRIKLIEIEKCIAQNKDKIDSLMTRTPIIEANRKSKSLTRIPDDVDFEMKDGNTTYEIVSHFNSNGDEFFLNQIIRKLGYK